MEKVRFILEAKVAPNEWLEIAKTYPKMKPASRFKDKEEALAAKAQLKSALMGPWKGVYKKYPIRLRELNENC